MPEFDFFHQAHERLQRLSGLSFHGFFQQKTGKLSHALDDERARHDRLEREMIVEKILAQTDVFDALGLLAGFPFKNAVYEQKTHNPLYRSALTIKEALIYSKTPFYRRSRRIYKTPGFCDYGRYAPFALQ